MNKTLRRLVAIGIMVASFAVAYLVIRFQPEVDHYIRHIGFAAYPLAIVIFVAVASAPFSMTDALAVMNGSIFGPLWGSVLNAVGLVFASMIGYWINRRASHLLDLEAALEKLPAWVKRFPVGSPAFLLSVRVIPGLGGTIATATAATFKVPIWVHMWTFCAIAIPICTILAIFGDRATVVMHDYEDKARIYVEHHRPHFNFQWRREPHTEPKASPSA